MQQRAGATGQGRPQAALPLSQVQKCLASFHHRGGQRYCCNHPATAWTGPQAAAARWGARFSRAGIFAAGTALLNR